MQGKCQYTVYCFDGVVENLVATSDNSVRLLRVYGEEIEHQQYPLPWVPKPPRRSKQQYSVAELHSNARLSEIALHSRIRSNTNPHSVEIIGLDHKFRHSPDAVTEDDIRQFLRAVTTAELYELRKADVILCTCSTAGAPRLTRKFYRVWSQNTNLVSRLIVIVGGATPKFFGGQNLRPTLQLLSRK